MNGKHDEPILRFEGVRPEVKQTARPVCTYVSRTMIRQQGNTPWRKPTRQSKSW